MVQALASMATTKRGSDGWTRACTLICCQHDAFQGLSHYRRLKTDAEEQGVSSGLECFHATPQQHTTKFKGSRGGQLPSLST